MAIQRHLKPNFKSGMSGVRSLLAEHGYTFGKRIATGSFSMIREATYKKTKSQQTLLACKIIRESDLPREYAEKFLPRVLEIFPIVNHENVISAHSVVHCERIYFLFMQLFDGDVLKIVSDKGGVTEEVALAWMRDTFSGLGYLHSKSIVHRDLRCEKLLISETGRIVITDFDFAKFAQKKTLSETYCGSRHYSAPEVISGRPYCPFSADIWSTGVILFVILNAEMPFSETTNLKRLVDDQMEARWKYSLDVCRETSQAVKNLQNVLLSPLPNNRPTARKALEHKWLHQSFD